MNLGAACNDKALAGLAFSNKLSVLAVWRTVRSQASARRIWRVSSRVPNKPPPPGSEFGFELWSLGCRELWFRSFGVGLRSRGLALGFSVAGSVDSDFGFRVLCSGFRVPDLRFRCLGFRA